MELTAKDVDLVAKFGTPVKSETRRYIVELKGLTEPLDFENPKDAGTKYGAQHLKGDGNDILLLNGLTPKQVDMMNRYLTAYERENGVAAEQMNTRDVKRMLGFLKRAGFDDRYCSDQAYKRRAFTPPGRLYKRKSDTCRAVEIPVGTTYSDGVKTQRANVEGALFIVDSHGNGRITNVPSDYRPVNPSARIGGYADAVKRRQSLLQKSVAAGR